MLSLLDRYYGAREYRMGRVWGDDGIVEPGWVVAGRGFEPRSRGPKPRILGR